MVTNMAGQKLIETARQELDALANNLDPRTREKLRQAREHALHQADRQSVFFNLPSFSGGFAIAAIVTLAVALGVLPNMADLPAVNTNSMASIPELFPSGVPDADAMEVIMSGEDMDFLENLDMYEWLDAEYG